MNISAFSKSEKQTPAAFQIGLALPIPWQGSSKNILIFNLSFCFLMFDF